MSNDHYIKNLMRKLRSENDGRAINGNSKGTQSRDKGTQDGDIKSTLSMARRYEIIGDKKRLIRMDGKNEEILKVLYPLFGVDATRFINLLVARFIKENPELVQEIKKSIRKL